MGCVPPALHCAVQRFCSGVNGQASQLSPPVTLQPDAAAVKHSAAVVWQFFTLESLWPDAAVVKHSAAVVWQFFPHESPWPDAAVVKCSFAVVW